MANKRMFSKDIVESDAFTSMSPQAQLLYLHLSMNADDDGLLNNAVSIARAYDIKPKALDELKSRRFVLDLGDGITCIKHWRMNNYVQKDRYKPTAYQEQFSKLKVKENGSYTDDVNAENTACIQFGYTLDTQNRLDKNRLDKSSNKYRKRISDFHKEDGVETDINATREKLFGKEQA